MSRRSIILVNCNIENNYCNIENIVISKNKSTLCSNIDSSDKLFNLNEI